jgi:uncharacterized protein
LWCVRIRQQAARATRISPLIWTKLYKSCCGGSLGHTSAMPVNPIANGPARQPSPDGAEQDQAIAGQGAPHAATWPARVLMLPITGYRRFVSPLLGPRCRFYPSCSEYALGALAEHGAACGLWLAVARLARCHPFNAGGYDPVPERRRRPESAAESGADQTNVPVQRARDAAQAARS